MKCNIYCNEREEMSINDINTFNVHSEVRGKIFYKSIRVNGTLYEAKDLIARRNYNNYTIQLKDGRYVEINKLYQEEYGGTYKNIIVLGFCVRTFLTAFDTEGNGFKFGKYGIKRLRR
jgi:hypothetical protein